jgi:hypothetical protein
MPKIYFQLFEGVDPDTLDLKRRTTNMLVEAWDRFVEGVDGEFHVRQVGLDLFGKEDYAKILEDEVIPLYIKDYVNTDLYVDEEEINDTEWGWNWNLTGKIPTFKELPKLIEIGQRIESSHPEFHQILVAFRVNIHDTDSARGVHDPVINVDELAGQVREILGGDDIVCIEIKHPEQEGEDSEEDSEYEVDDGSVFDDPVLPTRW